MDFIYRISWLHLFVYIMFVAPCLPVYAEEAQEAQNDLSFGVGWEQLSYSEKLPELSLVTSDTKVNNLVLYFNGTKRLNNYFVGLKGVFPIIYDDSQEYWEKAGQYEQSNSLEYRRTKADVLLGYSLNNYINPYVGTNWTYSHQKRSDFQTVNTLSVSNVTVTEEVNSLSLFLGLRGKIPLKQKWFFTYSIEYSFPYYSKVENSSVDGWKPTNIDGYSYSLTGHLEFLISEKTALIIQAEGGKLYWDGSDWETIGNSQAKWPENETFFIGGYVSFKKYF